MKETMKGILLNEEMIQKIQELAEKERRSFTRQVQVMLESILNEEPYVHKDFEWKGEENEKASD